MVTTSFPTMEEALKSTRGKGDVEIKISLEQDPHGKDIKEPGSKMDKGKVMLFTHLFSYFPLALEEVCRVSEYGAYKYTRMGWSKVPDGVERYTDALSRHLLAEVNETFDQDSGLYHAGQVAWNALARLELILQLDVKPLSKGNINV